MATVTLSATTRTDTGKGAARTLRSAGQVPAIIYGHAREAQPLAVNTRDLERLLDRIAAESTVIELDLAGTVSRTLIREIQRHPVKRDILHVDFQELVAGEKVSVNVPIVLTGTPDGVRNAGGILSQVMTELAIRVDPVDIPVQITVDVTNVTIGHSLHVGDIQVPAGVEVLADTDDTVATVTAPKAVVEAPVEIVEAPVEPELIRKPKEEEEAAEGEK